MRTFLTGLICNLAMLGLVGVQYQSYTWESALCALALIGITTASILVTGGRSGRYIAAFCFVLYWFQGVISLNYYGDLFAVGIWTFTPEKTSVLSQFLPTLPYGGLGAAFLLGLLQGRAGGSVPQGAAGLLRVSGALALLLAAASLSELPDVMSFAQAQIPLVAGELTGTAPDLKTLYEPTDGAVIRNAVEGPVDLYVIQSETFYDIRKSGIRLSSNPYVNYDRLKSEARWGNLSVPVQGGLTANSEFEFLTGVRSKDISCVPFDDFIDTQIPSLASRAAAAGFQTVGIHPHHGDFYKRNTVYPLLGFQNTRFLEDFQNPVHFGEWVADSAGFAQALKETAANPSGSNLVFYVTVQNHGPFLVKSKNPIYPSGLSRDDAWSIRNLAGGHRLSDQELGKFVETLRKSSKRSIVILYGDHQPAASHDYYRTLPYYQEKDNAYLTDYLVWDSAQLLPKGRVDTNILALGAYARSLVPGEVSLYDRFLLTEYPEGQEYLKKNRAEYEQVLTRISTEVRNRSEEALGAFLQ